MASTNTFSFFVPSKDSVASVHIEELKQHLRDHYAVSNTLRMLLDISSLPVQVHVEDSELVKEIIDGAFCFLPDLLALLIDGIETRTCDAMHTVDALEESLSVHFKLKPGTELHEVPPPFLRINPTLDQAALRSAHAAGKLPSCFVVDETTATTTA